MYDLAIETTGNAIAAIKDLAEARANAYTLPAQKEIARLLTVEGALSSAAKAFREKLFAIIEREAKNGIKITDCQSFVQSLKDCKMYPDNFPLPQSIYNGAKARQNGGRESKWEMRESKGLLVNLSSGESMQLHEFLQILRICKTFDKRKETRRNERAIELHKDTMQLIISISEAIKLGNTEKVESLQESLKVAWENAENKGIEFTEVEKSAYQSALIASPIVITRKAGSEAKAKEEAEAARQAEARAKAEAEAAKAEAARQAEARAKAEAEAEAAKAAKAQWEKDREAMRKKNAEIHIKMHESAQKYNTLLSILKKIPADCSNMKAKDMRDILETIQKTIA